MIDAILFKSIAQFIENEIEENVKKQFNIKDLQHNHPPLRFKVDDCAYCQKYGNIFQKPYK